MESFVWNPTRTQVLVPISRKDSCTSWLSSREKCWLPLHWRLHLFTSVHSFIFRRSTRNRFYIWSPFFRGEYRPCSNFYLSRAMLLFLWYQDITSWWRNILSSVFIRSSGSRGIKHGRFQDSWYTTTTFVPALSSPYAGNRFWERKDADGALLPSASFFWYIFLIAPAQILRLPFHFLESFK